MHPEVAAGIVVFGSFVVFYGIELVSRRVHSAPRPRRDIGFTLVGVLSQTLVGGALIGSIAGYIATKFWPQHADTLSSVSFWLAFPLIFVINEFIHYWLHRAAHEWRWLWKIHRTHHSAESLNTGVLYRYNVFWVMMIPHTWIGAFAIYFGLGWAFVAAVLLTYIVNVLTHTNFRWDLWLREKMPWSEPAWKVIERLITLPDTHHAHHAYGKEAHPNGNYAISIFLFDIIFGTAKISNCRQSKYGLPISPRLHWRKSCFGQW